GVARSRAPGPPRGWPRAMAPPRGLTTAPSRPRVRITASDWAAKASLSSTTARSSSFQPSRVSALFRAGAGPIPMRRGSTPAVAQVTTRARGSRPWRASASSGARRGEGDRLLGGHLRVDDAPGEDGSDQLRAALQRSAGPGQDERRPAHGLHAAGHGHLADARAQVGGDLVDGFEPGAAQAVDGGAADL